MQRAPKAREICDLLDEHEGPLTADFQRVYGLRLRDAVVDRDEDEILDLILWLPAGSAFRAAYGTVDQTKAMSDYQWQNQEELLLSIANLISVQTHTLRQVNSERRVKPPDLVKSPREAKKARKPNTLMGMVGALQAAQKGVS